jgi:hypothetical protein
MLSYFGFLLAQMLTTVSQGRCHHRCTSYWRHVLGVHQRTKEEPTAKLRPIAEQHPR